MVKVTLNDNLVPCSREKWVKGNPYSDLTLNILHARRLIRAAAQFFMLAKGKAVFSGYINEHEEGVYRIHLWHGEALLRTLEFTKLGYGGVMHVEIADREAISQDIFAPLTFLPEPVMLAVA